MNYCFLIKQSIFERRWPTKLLLSVVFVIRIEGFKKKKKRMFTISPHKFITLVNNLKEIFLRHKSKNNISSINLPSKYYTLILNILSVLIILLIFLLSLFFKKKTIAYLRFPIPLYQRQIGIVSLISG